MDSIYWIIITALLLLAAFDLINGVANDAVNFLNSAIGSKAAPVRVILTVASIGVLVGACFSGGMMEVARNGIFHPDMFSYHEVMLLFLGVMISEVILLDTFNTFGLPTSTTVSLVFGILGSAVATALFKISKLRLVQSVWDFINTDKAFEIVTSILLSVAIAFTVGTIVMWISRLAFTFKYQSRFKWFGCFWCGIAMTAIAYFAVFKGLKESTLMEPSFIQYIDQNLGMALLTAFGGFSVLMFLLQHLFMTNILRLTVLAGTFSLALAFAGNDLVNFIGVFMGGLDSFQYASSVAAAGGSPSSITSMECLMPGQGMPVNHYILFAAGCMMIFALWFSKKAKTVIATGVELSRQGEGGIERFGSVPPARAIVRSAIALGRGVKRLIPARMLVRMNHQWDPAPQPLNPKDRVAFDLIRATVNLTVASLLIAWATGRQLPLSTTYVTFMVAMGSSLADKAWGRESAVYRVTGVLTVISGWFMTGLAAFTLAAVIDLILGCVMLFVPAHVTQLLCVLVGAGITIYGLFNILSFIFSRGTVAYSLELLIGLCATAFGAYSLFSPDFLSKFLFIVLGLLIMVSSICGIKRAFTLKSYGFERWYLMLISAIVTLVLAVTIVLYPTLYGDMLMMAIGIVMIIEAVSDLLGIHRLSKFIKDNVTITYGE